MDADIIDPRLIFYGFEEFFYRRVLIKTIFQTKPLKEQRIYCWWLYSRPFISDTLKNYMWEYLQNDISDLDFILIHSSCNRRGTIKDIPV